MMRNVLTIAVIFALGCGAESDEADRVEINNSSSSAEFSEDRAALSLEPTIEVLGTSDVFAMLDVTRLSFDAELFLIPVDVGNNGAGDAVNVRFDFRKDAQSVVLPDRAIQLMNSGAYRVLLRLKRADNGVSVGIDGRVTGAVVERLHKADSEPAPTAASEKDEEPAPTAARELCEPAPTAADGNDDADDAEHDCEPAPTAADENEEAGEAYEPAPTAADGNEEAPPSAEPAPTAAEPAPTAAREKATIDQFDLVDENVADASLSITTRQEFEFYAGIVNVVPTDSALVIRWDVRSWLRAVLAEPLGLSQDEIELSADDFAEAPGFAEERASFDLETL
jgi:hypothetical protein